MHVVIFTILYDTICFFTTFKPKTLLPCIGSGYPQQNKADALCKAGFKAWLQQTFLFCLAYNRSALNKAVYLIQSIPAGSMLCVLNLFSFHAASKAGLLKQCCINLHTTHTSAAPTADLPKLYLTVFGEFCDSALFTVYLL